MSGKPSLIFRRLEIRRTPGIRSPYTIEQLTDGINIAHGPNASGKTTTARAVQMLLWNNMDGWSRASLAGWIDLDGSEWFIDIDAGAVRIQRDGSDGAQLPIASAEHRDRYILTLHDLLQADNADFAEIILRESTGGYDIDAAREQLGYGFGSGRSTGNTKSVREAQRRVRDAESAQRELAQEQRDLALVRERLRGAQEAATRAGLLKRALTARNRVDELEIARQRLEAFPQGMSRLAGDEIEKLDEIRERISEYEQRRRRNEGDIQSAREIRAQSGLPDSPLPPGLVASLRARCQELHDVARTFQQAEADLKRARIHRDRARQRIGDRATDAQLVEFETAGLRELAEVARRLATARENEAAVESLHNWIGKVEAPRDIAQLQQGITFLNGWLRDSATPAGSLDGSRYRTMLWLIAGLTVIETAALGIVVHPVILVLVPVVVALAIWANRPRQGTAPGSGRASVLQGEYARLGIEQPRAWKVDEVEALVVYLNDRLRKAIVDQEKAQRWADLRNRREAAARHRQQVEAEWQRLAGQYGIDDPDPADLYLLAQNLDRWQEADNQVRTGVQRVEEAKQRHRSLLCDINEDLALAGYEAVEDHTDALARTEDLDRRIQEFRDATTTIATAERSLCEDILPEITHLNDQQRSLFAALGLEHGDDLTLKAWLEQLDDYREARDEVERLKMALRNAELELGDDAALLSRSPADLEAELREAEGHAAEFESLYKTISETEARIDIAKQARDLEQALVDQERARDVLREDRETAYRKAAGWMLTDLVRQRTRDRDRPKVFHRARELFSRITQGRYELQFVDDPEPSFSATDQTTRVSHSLDELSSATRVQLLMAVRIAFVEEMEAGPKLPLILDETLGNADEHRAEAIIAATCEICRSGRQIFYFTAQHDEVGKWVRILRDQPDIPHCVISLVEARKLPEFEPSVLHGLEHKPPSVPAPNGTDHAGYGIVLGVPALDPSLDVGSTHLWYLIHDTGSLHHLLSMGISTWGQLRTLVQFGGDDLTEPDVFEGAVARARVLEAAFDGWRVGQGRPVDRAAVLDSGAFSATFIDRVVREANRVNGDAERLLRALEAGCVKRLRNSDIEEFHDYLIEHRYLDTSEPLSRAELHARVLGAAGADIAAGVITVADVDELLQFLPPLRE